MPNSFVTIPSFNVVRQDTPGHFAKHGVCMYIHNSLKFVCCDVHVSNCLAVELVDLNLFVIAVYRPPSNSHLENSHLLEFLLTFCTDKEVLILGDFNLPSLHWEQNNCTLSASGVDKEFWETFLSLGLTQWISEPTYPQSGNVLDLILTTDTDRIGAVKVLAPIPGCDHCPTLCEYLFNRNPLSETSMGEPRRRWHHGKYEKISKRLSEIDWDLEFHYLDVQEAYSRFLDIVTPLIQDHIPEYTLTCSRKVPWKVQPPSSLLSRRKAAWDRFKASRSQLGRHSSLTKDALCSFFDVNRSVKNFALKSQSGYEMQLVEDFVSNPKQLHAYLRRKKVGCPTVGPLRLADGSLTDDALCMAETLASAFESVYVDTLPSSEPAEHQRVDCEMPPVEINIEDVMYILKSLDPSSAAGPDSIHPRLLKSCASQLAYPLLKIFQLSLQQCHLPNEWKKSIVIPIFKKGSRFTPLNYRPVSLTSVPCKCLERVIARKLYEYLEDNDILTEHQFGFRASRSTMDQMILVYNDITSWLDQGSAVDLILFDFSKAFDVVSHHILLVKLSQLGIDAKLLKWIEGFLIGRHMTVALGDAHSNLRSVRSGVPQGSVLGPVLFLLFVNHIAAKLTCHYKIFADDLKIYLKLCDPNRTNLMINVQQCQADITRLNQTAESWGLHLNKDKCVAMRFQRGYHHLPTPSYHIDGDEIKTVDSHMDLGVMVDSDLKFHLHILSTAQKAGGLAQNIIRTTVCRSPEFMLPIFCSHIRPILEYCSCLWHTGYIGDLRALESVQRRWTKRIDGMSELDYGTRLRTLNLYSVSGRLLRADMILCWKIFHGKCCISPNDVFIISPHDRTRGHRFKLCHVRTQTDVRKRAFGPRCVNQWNCLSDQIVSVSELKTFKRLLAEALGDKLFEYPN